MRGRSRLSILVLLAALCAASSASAQALYWLDTNYGAPTLNLADANGVSVSSVALAAGTLPEGLALGRFGQLYWAEAMISGAKINRAEPTLANITPILSGISVGRGLAVDVQGGFVFWTTSNYFIGGTVRRCEPDGSGVIVLSLPTGFNPRGIAVDEMAGMIYWADFNQDAIYRANRNLSGMELWQQLEAGASPYGVAFDPSERFVYWTEYGSGTIKRASADVPPHSASVVLSGLAQPTYLACDPVGQRLYWSESAAGAQHIKRASTDGTSMTTLPCPITTFGGLAFRSDQTVAVPESKLPADFTLERIRPNPASGPLQVRFSLPGEARVRLSVYDLQGREVDVLADGVLPAGDHERTWRPQTAQAGIYFARLAAADQTRVQRLALIP
ncbi:MAG: T9SS type A sorting domain-containing protein [Gaiellales bacterium]